jgi:predicted Zn-dependent peptidase
MKNFMILGALAVSTALSAQNKIDFEEYDLDNGLHVILHEDHSTPIAAVTVLYHVGSKNEDPERTGFAHFFEHLLFEGSENIKRGEFDSYVTNAGGALNANTSQDRTFYFELLPSNQMELGLWLESERMLHANIQNIGVETQREVVKEEKRQRVDNQPYGSWLENMMKRLYTEHPYNWVPIGSMDHLNAAQLDEFMAFYKKFYVPNNATLSIAGDIDVEKTKELIAAYFGDIPRGADVIQPTVQEPALGGEKTATIYDNIQLPAIMMGYRMPPQTSDDAYALQMASSVLSGGPS